MSSRRSSIRNRVRAVILVTSVTALLATTIAFLIYEVISYKAQLANNLATLASVVADNSAAPLAFENKDTAIEILTALKANPNVLAAALYDLDGKLFVKYPLSISENDLPARLGRPGFQFNDGGLVLFRTVIQEGKPVGTLYLRSSLQGLYARLWRYAAIATGVLAGSLAIAFVLSTLLQRRITDPILSLTNAAQNVAQKKDYSVRVPKLTQDELGTLTDAFNQMLAQTQRHQDRLTEQARLLDLSNDAMIVKDMGDRIIYWNRGAEEIYGWTTSEAIGKVKHELLRTEFSEPKEQIDRTLLLRGRWSGELVQICKDGTRIHVSTRWALDRDSNGKPSSILITDNDITFHKEAEELMKSEAKRLESLVQQRTAKLQDTIGELEAFSYSISHDMRAPLRAMNGYAKAVIADYSDKLDPEGVDYLNRICRAATRLDSLIQDVLSYSKVAKGEISLHAVNLEKLIGDILPSHPELQPPNARIDIEKPLPTVLGHEAYLTQCITNLLGNAVKFVAPGVQPTVRIRAERFDQKVRIWFEDNGIGIDPSHFPRIFQIFGQVYGEKKYPGTGIGLAIVRKAVQRMDGQVGVESVLDKGSRFWIILNEAA